MAGSLQQPLPSALSLPPFRPTWEVALAVGGHLLILVVIVAGEWLTRPGDDTLIDPNEVMQVSMVALPKSTSSLPDKPMRTPDPPKGVQEAPTPPPPDASQMVLKTPEATPDKGQPDPQVDRSKDREALLNAARREALLRDMSAPVGPQDRTATDPNGVDPSEAILGPAGSGTIDPELARYIAACRARILPNFKPLPSVVAAHPEYQVQVLVTVGPDGKLGTPRVLKGTGDPSFDNAAVSAVARTGSLPVPPEKWRQVSADKGVIITLSASDAG